jgi:hypothetical protein
MLYRHVEMTLPLSPVLAAEERRITDKIRSRCDNALVPLFLLATALHPGYSEYVNTQESFANAQEQCEIVAGKLGLNPQEVGVEFGQYFSKVCN